MEMLKKNMKIIISLTFFGLVSFSSYSEAGLTYEEKIKLEASSLHQELSPTEIKKRAIALKEWSSIDYFEKDIQKFIDVLDDEVFSVYPWFKNMDPSTIDKIEAVKRRTWKPALSLVGINGIPKIKDAGNE